MYMTDTKIESLTRKVQRLNIRDHLTSRMPPRSSYPANDNKRNRNTYLESEKPGIIRKNPISKTKRLKTARGKRKKHTKKRKYKKKINS